MFRPILFVILIRLDSKLRRGRDRHKGHPALLEFLQSGAGPLMGFVDAEHLDAVATAGDVETPIPRTAHKRRLRVERVVPAPDDEFRPALGVEGEVDVPGPPGEFVLFGQVLGGNLVPEEAPVGTDLDPFGPAATAAENDFGVSISLVGWF